MGHEALPKQTLEPTTPQQEEISLALEEAQKIFYSFTQDPSFHAKCMKEGIDPYSDTDAAGYWLNVAEHASEKIQNARSRHGESLKLSAFELLTATPAYLYEQDALDNDKHKNSAEKKQAKEQVSYFNSLIRDFAVNYPETSVSGLTKSLLNMTGISIEDPRMRAAATDQIRATVRGAQHEVGFGQILVSTGRRFRQTSTDEDLSGVDYFVQGVNITELMVDVKASSGSVIAAGGFRNGFARKPNGKIVIFSQIEDREFHDKFYISNEAAEAKAVQVDRLLHAAETGQMTA